MQIIQIISSTIVFCFCCVSAKPFLYGAPRALTRIATSASASASNPSEPITNISDLRRNKPEKLQTENLDDDDFFKEADDLASQSSSIDDQDLSSSTNEASPGLIQKKINKILTKLRLISMWTNSGPGNTENTSDDDDFQKEQDEFDKEFSEDFTTTAVPIKDKEEIVENSGYIYDGPTKAEKRASESSSRLSLNPGGIGVFFMELIGSLVGLAYGAAAQIQNNGTPQPTR